MKKFLQKIGLYITLVVVLLIVPSVVTYYILPVNYSINGLAATIDKHERLETIDSPKIIVVGGSGCGMGINSAMIDSAFPQYDVVNMGLFGQLGLLYMMNEVRDNMNEGDIVVVIPEYQHFYYQFYGDLGMMRTVKIYPKGIRYLSHWRQWMVITENFAPYLLKQVVENSENPDTIARMWNRKSVNEYGDFCGHLNDSDTVDVSAMPLFKSGANLQYDPDVIEALNEFGNYAETKGADAVFMYPSIPVCTYEKNREVIRGVDSAMTADCSLPILNTPASPNFSDVYFFDTVYHMNKAGRDKRTEVLIEDLQRWLSVAKK